MALSQKKLKEILNYNPETGILTWTKNRRKCKKGNVVGNISSEGYIETKILGKRCSGHRLAFLYMRGRWPKQIDHINHVRSDNRWSNLRECTQSQNMANQQLSKVNTSGYKGVYKNKNLKWYAQVCYLGKSIHVGMHDCRHEAAEAYNRKALELFGEFAYLNEINR